MAKKQRLFIILAIVLFVVVFAVLLTVATLYDLQISQILTKNALPAGAYFSTSNFGLFFETVGSAPIYLMAAFGATIAFWWAIRKQNKVLSIALPVAMAFVVFVAVFFFVKDIFSYVGEHMHDHEYMSKPYVVALIALLSLIISALSILCWKQVKPETNDKLIKLSLVILVSMAGYLIIHFIKGPIGRMRYRAMNYSDEYGFDMFTRWYVINGKRNLVPVANGVEISDSCKSFPSGHTYSAAIVYGLICLPDLLESFNKKWIKALLYVGTIGFTATVAISRIVVGAHYMSDVLFGGTLSFLCMIIGREIFIFKGSHLQTLFSKKQTLPLVEEPTAETVEEPTAETVEEPVTTETSEVAENA